MKVRVNAPAKINLTLQVGTARADGLHPLQSVVAFAELAEWVEAEPAATLSLAITGEFKDQVANDDSNLVLRAARALALAASMRAPGAALTLHKDMPVASGIGGGSSDAAATLKALNALWGLGLNEAGLVEIATGLGSDVPVCVAGRSAYMTGAGERFVDVAVPALHVVLVNPRRQLSTADVYGQFDFMGLGGGFRAAPPPAWSGRDDAFAAIAEAGNDLYRPACALIPELTEITAYLRADPRVRWAQLSGSGATMFALVERPDDRDSCHGKIAAEYPNWWVRSARLGA